MRARVREHLRSRSAAIVAAVALALGTVVARGEHVVRGASENDAIARALVAHGVEVAADSIVVRPIEDGVGTLRSVTFLGANDGEPSDVFHATVRTAGSTVLDVVDVTDVSRTAGAAEEQLVSNGEFAAYLVRVRGAVEAVTVLDLRSEPASATAGWSRIDRLRNAVTNLQETGRFAGFGRRRYAIDPAVENATLETEGPIFVLRLPAGTVRLDGAKETPIGGASLVSFAREEKALAHGIAWVVDTVRSLSFVGPEPIAWLENRVYAIKDRVLRIRYRLVGASSDDVASLPSSAERRRVLAGIADLGEIGFPPPRVPPIDGASTEEGEWLPIVDDPFVGSYPNAAPAFAETSLGVDRDRPFARVYLVAWDTRQVQLRMVSGTREPESADGRFGTGIIPRDPATLPRVVAAFNGGFQAMHGEFGMMADGVVYLPPKPFAATISVYRDGRVAMGSWLGLRDGARVYTESAALSQIPSDMIDMRQNLTSVIEGERWNPWGRWYWGAANVNANEQTYVDRSGICITREGFTIYFWGNSMSPESLGDVMRRARCERGMHLDMNSKHTAFEYYRIAPTTIPFPALARPLAGLEFESDYPGVSGFHARGRMAVTRMEPQQFPRYLAVEPRDFFYLTLRPTLPGPNLADGTRFSVHALPQTPYPWAFARAERQGARIVRIDASRAIPAPVDATSAVHGTREVASLPLGDTGSQMLVATVERGFWRCGVVDWLPACGTLVGRGPMPNETTTAALGVDGEGFLVYVEADTGGAVRAALEAAGVSRALAIDGRLAVGAPGTRVTVDGLAAESDRGVGFLERRLPYAEVLNPNVAPVGYARWGRIQDTRIRYRPEPGAPRRFMRPPS